MFSFLTFPEPKAEVEPVNWMKRKDYGQVPRYLTRIQNQINSEYDLAQSIVIEQDKLDQQKKYTNHPHHR